MKSVVVSLTLFVAIASTRGQAKLALENIAISVEYGRPSLKGRDMASLLPVGYVWRLGADEATTFETSHDLAFGDVVIPAARYSLFLKRASAQEWALVFNTEVGQWGTQHDVTLDFAEVPMTQTRASAPTEVLTLQLLERSDDRGELEIRWGEDVLTAAFAPR